ncbi:MAG: hypothetical protein CMG57_07645 [Candidatus Marinimicrobia bacterium]|nr:hypothetical protein [Candidatus Neomarinimicrobiota bacterium]
MKKVFFVIFFLSVLSAQDTKTLTLKSGDKITGQVISETETTITIINPIMGEMLINKSDLKQQAVVITLQSGDVVRGELVSRSDSEMIIQSSFGEVSIPTTQITNIDEGGRPQQEVQYTPFGPAVVANKESDDEWFFSKERLMDIWFDPTGYTIGRNKLYLSGLSWGFGLSDKIQITSRWTNYFFQDFNIRPKMTLFQTGNVESQSAFAAGIHLHTRGLPSKYKWVDNKDSWWDYNSIYNSEIGDYENTDSTYRIEGGWVNLGSKREMSDDDAWNRYEYTGPWDGDKMWFEVFSAYTISRLRSSGNGRVNTTFGASAVIYPDEDIAPRVYGAIDIDVTRNIKVMAEVFYDPYYVEWLDYVDDNNDSNTDLFFDVGFMTNKIPLFWWSGASENLWIGYHFQRPFFAFYWKI